MVFCLITTTILEIILFVYYIFSMSRLISTIISIFYSIIILLHTMSLMNIMSFNFLNFYVYIIMELIPLAAIVFLNPFLKIRILFYLERLAGKAIADWDKIASDVSYIIKMNNNYDNKYLNIFLIHLFENCINGKLLNLSLFKQKELFDSIVDKVEYFELETLEKFIILEQRYITTREGEDTKEKIIKIVDKNMIEAIGIFIRKSRYDIKSIEEIKVIMKIILVNDDEVNIIFWGNLLNNIQFKDDMYIFENIKDIDPNLLVSSIYWNQSSASFRYEYEDIIYPTLYNKKFDSLNFFQIN